MLSLVLFIALGTLMPLSILIVIALSLYLDQRNCFYLLSLFCYYVPAFHIANSFEYRTKGRSKFFSHSICP
jgi:hypothetical protein